MAPNCQEALDSREAAPAFHGVFAAKTTGELMDAYNAWSATYDHCINKELAGDCTNHMTTETITLMQKTIPQCSTIQHVLDCGAGTGAAGPYLRMQYPGLQSLVGFDLSSGMLKVAESRGCYTDLVQGCCPDMTAAAKVCEEKYDLIFCAGTFTPNHAPATTLAELVPLVRQGGFVCFSVRTYWYENKDSGFMDAQSQLEKEGKWIKLAEEVRTYLPKENVFAYYFVYQVC